MLLVKSLLKMESAKHASGNCEGSSNKKQKKKEQMNDKVHICMYLDRISAPKSDLKIKSTYIVQQHIEDLFFFFIESN